MSKFDEAIEKYVAEAKRLKLDLSTELLTAVAKGLGPSIYKADAELVSGGDQAELDRVKQNFLIKKLGLKDSAELDKAIHEVVETLGTSNRNKYRALFYALLVKKFKKESAYK